MKRFFALCLLVAACDSPPPETPANKNGAPDAAAPTMPAAKAEAPRETPDAPFRQQMPVIEQKLTWSPPHIGEAKLTNGLRVLVLERHELPIVSVRLAITVGAGDLPDVRPGVVSFMEAMLEQGTTKHSALQLSDEFEALGVQRAVTSDWDEGGITIHALTEKLDPAIELMAEVALTPNFPEAEIDKLRGRRSTAILSEKNAPPTIAQNVIASALYGRAHPYGHSLFGEEADVKKITRDEVMKTYHKVFAPQNAVLVVAGDFTVPAILPKLEAAFGSWKAKGAATRKPPALPAKPATDKRVVLVDRPGAAQSQVQLVRLGVAHSAKDREAIQVANAILGGSFTSRININLREKNAFTYGVRSHFLMRHGAGPFTAGGAIFSNKTGPAVKELFAELDNLKKNGPTEEELGRAKEHIKLSMPARFETVGDMTSAMAELAVFDLPLDDYERRLQRTDAVAISDVKRVMAEYFSPESMTVVIVGDKTAVSPQLEPLALGPIDERDSFGEPLSGSPRVAEPAAGSKKKKKKK